MRKALTLAILGTAVLAPISARAQTAPAFIAATACEAAAPLRTDALATRRAVRAEQRRAGQRPALRVDQRRAPAVSRAGKPSAEQPPIVLEVPDAADEMPTVRRAVHFCVGTPGASRVWVT